MFTFLSHYQSTSISKIDGLSLDTNGSDELRLALAVMSYVRLDSLLFEKLRMLPQGVNNRNRYKI